MTRRLTLMLAIAILLLVNSLAIEGGPLDTFNNPRSAPAEAAPQAQAQPVVDARSTYVAPMQSPARDGFDEPVIEDYAGPEPMSEFGRPSGAAAQAAAPRRPARQRRAQPDGSLSPQQLGVEE
ncbi:MAG: hypothetical protein KDE15_14270 [Erythrobacter sp.]|nr:hypothetical protein [Erythrobacter sp.]